MGAYLLACAGALWLGVLTSISPCPLATNIAAISYIGRQVGRPRMVLAAGLLYTFGRALTYAILGALLVASLLSMSEVSYVLQKYMHLLLGPLLILAGMFLLELLSMNFRRGGISAKLQERIDRSGIWGAGLLGIIFALTFCPVSAALFFLSLIPLAIENKSSIVLPSIYGAGTALPVVVFTVLLALSAQKVAAAFGQIAKLELWARQLTGVVFILVGIYYVLYYIFGVLM